MTVTRAFEVQSPITVFAALEKQVFDVGTSTAHLLFYTSSQGPYQLHLASFACASPATKDCGKWIGSNNAYIGALATTAQKNALLLGSEYASIAGVSTLFDSDATHTAQCYNGITGTGTTDYSQTNTTDDSTRFTICSQHWYMRITNPGVCADPFLPADEHVALNINGDWSAVFDVTCHESYKGACNLRYNTSTTLTGGSVYPNLVTLTFSTASDDYCPRILDTQSATIELNVFQDYNRAVPQTQFVFGTSSYFTATLHSTIAVSDFFAEEISITNGYAAENWDPASPVPVSDANVWVLAKQSQATTTPRQVLFSNGFKSANPNDIASTYFALTNQPVNGACLVGSKQNSADLNDADRKSVV